MNNVHMKNISGDSSGHLLGVLVSFCMHAGNDCIYLSVVAIERFSVNFKNQQ